MRNKIILFLLFIVNSLFKQSAAQIKDTLIYSEKYRPQYHLTSPKGALFDPTALVYVNGLYQVNRRLGVSNDLVHWELQSRQRLNTDSTLEMSGSVVIDENNSSGFGINGKPPLVAVYSTLRISDGRQSQCIAYSNDEGITWNAYDKNPVIDIGSNEFRDPQVFWHAQSHKWIMAVAMAAEQKVRFYNSDNLKDWKYLSEFGQMGAIKGVWECPDIFPLPVDDNGNKIKWVLVVSVQPIGGQYFIGDFDGKKFAIDNEFQIELNKLKNIPKQPVGKVLFDFESDLSGWESEGNAFAASPANSTLPYQSPVIGYSGNKLINSYYHKDSSTGKIKSPSFVVNKKYINFLIGGGDHPKKTCINLYVADKLVRTKTGMNTEVLYPANWDVTEFNGQSAYVEIVDDYTGDMGHILIDQITLSDTPAINEREETKWIDYGPDFYAARSWVNGPDERRIMVAWMGSWLYAFSVPTNPWKGGHTFPRQLQLKIFPEGIGLIQNPIEEIKKLRGKQIHLENISLRKEIPFKDILVDKNSYELNAELEVKNDDVLKLEVCKSANEKTILVYNANTETLELDRSQSGQTSFSTSFANSYKGPLKIRNNKIKLRVLIDQSSIEVFGNDGEVALTSEIFPDTKSSEINLTALNGDMKLVSLDLYELRSIWSK